MPSAGTVTDLFHRAVALEKAAEDFYHHLAAMFAGEPDLARFWRRIADEERGHAAFLERMRGKLAPEVLSMPADMRMLDLAQKGLEHSVVNLTDTIKNLDDAYQLAIELESAETNAVFDFILTNFPVDELAKTQAFLRVQLNKHASAIENEFPTRFKSRLMRRETLPGTDNGH